MYTGNQLRDMFLKFFKSKGHKILPSASLIPKDDPTLLLTVAGMVPFKPYFMRKVEPPFPRATTSQKCVRTPDLEVVGKTARHHTFFEMLGNFSFGDYFKSQAIPWAWEFVTEVLKLPIDQLWITVHPEDEEAKNLWIEKTGVSPERIKYDPENLWAAGPVGPCGYCSEIYVDLGEQRSCGKPGCALGCDCDRFLEIWNLVFMQYNRDESGMLTPLPKQNIDTGMGLERIASVMQGVASNFDTDLFLPIINKVAELSGTPYHDNPKSDTAMKVVADHTRAVSFMLSDGIRPGSEGRGYVLRRILRRAIRYARLLGIDKPFLEQIFLIIQRDYSHHYPELKENENFILNHLRLEEKNFQATLEQGTQILQEKVKTLQEAGEAVLSGGDAFYLYETYGFPVELTEEMLIEQGMSVDMEAFNAAAEEHRRLAKEQSQQMKAVQESAAISEKAKALGTTPFLGYHELAANTKVEALFRDGEEVKDAAEGDEVLIFLRESPFYAESGGQISDSGVIRTQRAEAKLMEVKKGVTGTVYHRFLITQGVLNTGDEVEALVDEHLRLATARHHSATHLLQSALRTVLGEHVQQAGSLVTPDRLRFDFTHFSALTPAELQRVEDLLNEAVLANMPVTAEEMSLDAAKASGATALFGEKYGDTVRVVSMGDYSMELCGGTHIHATGDIGLVKIISEGGIGAGLRRIEAVAGAETLKYMRSLNDQIHDASQLLKAQPSDLTKRIQGLLVQVKDLEKEVQQLHAKVAKSEVESLLEQVKDIHGVPVLAAKVSAQDMDALRNTADLLKDKMKTGVLVLGAAVEGKVNWVTVVTPTGLSGLHAGQIIKEVAKITGGGGGGRPDMAQAGGKDAAKLGEALDQVPAIIKSYLK
ncbi:alanyl-tRNA synthetase [Desulfitobacterium dehalogenans ATCC 51507]|uniref:Alanine--tRNA ligase n=1 Tax=Desulfitobacterium dehalogenans (strain ATCC 51507 / DSM 9161 / JW/IU-DC1) TaxID=756499 RepID=I4ABF6_DESDJ|nr:alanine--tRNA ligase [Desulfitobacterium dehalogenans]AFM01291.1 alanyl-tRNA synthetase [Desulfitobacterium dehalogenans ATCC 51507]